ncbi:hypothetical protein [Nocardioides campestrisoli]|uniref:hypothetical protein n=1 Tax=Nocardioides campestrisoli TaxID=2736757 RepID=UPI0015E7B53E|nr:hypothetical protein [Nocardioides campestrisoli]
MSNYAPTRTTYDTGDRRWLPNLLMAETHGVTVAPADVADDANGLVKSGSLVPGEGLVLNDFTIKTGEKHHIAVVHKGTVDRRYLPTALTLPQETALKGLVFINGTAPTA